MTRKFVAVAAGSVLALLTVAAVAQIGARSLTYRDSGSRLRFTAPGKWRFDDPNRRQDQLGFKAVLEDQKTRSIYPYIGLDTFRVTSTRTLRREADRYGRDHLSVNFRSIKSIRRDIHSDHAVRQYRMTSKNGKPLRAVSVFQRNRNYCLVATWIGPRTGPTVDRTVQLLNRFLRKASRSKGGVRKKGNKPRRR